MGTPLAAAAAAASASFFSLAALIYYITETIGFASSLMTSATITFYSSASTSFSASPSPSESGITSYFTLTEVCLFKLIDIFAGVLTAACGYATSYGFSYTLNSSTFGSAASTSAPLSAGKPSYLF